MDFGFFKFRGENFREFGFQILLVGINFRGYSCTVFESNKNGSHLVMFVTVFATNFIEVQQM